MTVWNTRKEQLFYWILLGAGVTKKVTKNIRQRSQPDERAVFVILKLPRTQVAQQGHIAALPGLVTESQSGKAKLSFTSTPQKKGLPTCSSCSSPSVLIALPTHSRACSSLGHPESEPWMGSGPEIKCWEDSLKPLQLQSDSHSCLAVFLLGLAVSSNTCALPPHSSFPIRTQPHDYFQCILNTSDISLFLVFFFPFFFVSVSKWASQTICKRTNSV